MRRTRVVSDRVALLASRAMKTCYAHFTFPTALAAGDD